MEVAKKAEVGVTKKLAVAATRELVVAATRELSVGATIKLTVRPAKELLKLTLDVSKTHIAANGNVS